ncbi:monofunctional biosynthetic peptidoglycan transglycosylase [Fodinibius salsisoli]|uniref:Biosynthetic peptidoglycan transglycosylase n=1 Tax=Fodinibius salsisoli TaxID=2820877 RepID=A0ABT3PHU3_9BACT|nr:monofunctional biosynthetic peptidoglycan transglycosylase [Fodinibius salsisoli]MCW9705475.1 monofunctional biosynthetic peptidoglycan transglycosylase [Fodinibius salsisoli]
MMVADSSPLWYKLKNHTSQVLQWIGRAIGGIILISLLFILLLRWINPPTSAFMMQRSVAAWWNGEENFELYQSWTDWEDISPHIKMAAITSEDQNFANHWGIDFGSVQKALEEYERGQGLRGASTITQQTAKNLFLWPAQSYIRKGIEAYTAFLLELLWSKERILEVYLNIVEFGNGVYGVQAASERYFNTPPGLLSKSQSALMVTALPAPKRYNLAAPSSYMRERQRWVMQYMDLLGNSYYLDKL